jgi:hypothetical protein
LNWRRPKRLSQLARGVSIERREGERARIEAVDLDPHQPVPLQRTDEADVALGLEVEIEIEEELDVLAGTASCCRAPPRRGATS